MTRKGQLQSFDAVERELAAYSDVPESKGAAPAENGTFSPRVQVTHGSAKKQASFWAQLEEEAAQSEREIIAAYERKAASAAGAGLAGAAPTSEFTAASNLETGSSAVATSEGETPGDAATDPGQGDADAAGEQPAEPTEPAAPTAEERYARLMEVVNKKPGHREILIRTLRHCREPREFSEVEAVIQSYPEFKLAGQNPYRLITFLVEGGGLEQLEIGFDGNEISPEQKQGLTGDEVDDLIDCFHLRTTDVGRMVADEMEPQRRIGNIFALFMDRQAYYAEIMEFCSQPRKFSEIEALFKGRDLSAVRTLHPEAGMAVKPTVFVDNLEKAGAIVWKDGWVVTREGEAYLRAIGS